jgi:hypothetical protein
MDARKKVRPTAAVRRANHRFEFHERRKLFIRVHNETLSAARAYARHAMNKSAAWAADDCARCDRDAGVF